LFGPEVVDASPQLPHVCGLDAWVQVVPRAELVAFLHNPPFLGERRPKCLERDVVTADELIILVGKFHPELVAIVIQNVYLA
jgi:hypothetical protein